MFYKVYFVRRVSKNQHLFFRGVAAFIFAPYLIYLGYKYKNYFLLFIGIGTLVTDTYTFTKTLNVKDV